MKLSRTPLISLIVLLFAPCSQADTTVRYRYDFKTSVTGQPIAAAMTAVQAKLPKSSVIQIKGKLSRTTALQYVLVSDFEKQVITLIDPVHHQYSTVYMKDYADQALTMIQALPKTPAEAQKALDSMQSTFTSHETGKRETIAGIDAEETEMTLTVSMPIPTGPGSSTEAEQRAQPPILFQLVMHVWTPDLAELQRVPALSEFNALYGDPTAKEVMNPAGSMQSVFGSVPGMGKGFADLVQALQAKGAVILRTQEEMFMPMVAKMMAAQARAKAGEQGEGVDPTTLPDEKAPLMQITVEVDEISGAPIDEAVFAVPRDCQLVSVPDLLKANLPAAQTDAAEAPGASDPVAASKTAVPEN